jgi:hypothetical protein
MRNPADFEVSWKLFRLLLDPTSLMQVVKPTFGHLKFVLSFRNNAASLALVGATEYGSDSKALIEEQLRLVNTPSHYHLLPTAPQAPVIVSSSGPASKDVPSSGPEPSKGRGVRLPNIPYPPGVSDHEMAVRTHLELLVILTYP